MIAAGYNLRDIAVEMAVQVSLLAEQGDYAALDDPDLPCPADPTTANTYPRALLRVAEAGLCGDGTPYWWPCLEDNHPYQSQWVPMIEYRRDGSRETEPLTDEDREVLSGILEALKNDS